MRRARAWIVFGLALVTCALLAAGDPTGAGAAAADTGTLGVTTVGTLAAGAGANYLDSSGPYALSTSATLTKLTAYVRGGSGSFALRGVVYADSGGSPGALVAVTSEVTIAASQAAGWVDLPLPSPVAVSAGSYWLGYWFGSSGAGFYYASVTGSERYVRATYSATGSPPGTYGSASTSASSYSLYATYTTSSGGSPPANTAPPAISGTAQQGQTLTAAPGTWSNSPTSYAYQWQDCDTSGAACTAIGGATAQTYVLQSSDVDKTVRVAVTASNASGSSSPAVSAATATVAASGGGGGGGGGGSGGTLGQTSVGTLADSGGAGWLDVSGPYALGAAGSVSKLTAYVAGGAAVSHVRGVIYADAGGAPGALAAVTPEVAIPAGAAAGWLDLPLSSPVQLAAGSYWLGYWYADSAGRHSYASQAGAERYARAAYSSTASPPSSFGSASTSSSSYSLYATIGTSSGGGSPPASTAPPAISGTPRQGVTLTASTGSWSNDPTGYAYQWQDCDTGGADCSAIGGAASATYAPTASDVGKTLRVEVTATNAAGSATASSAATAAVAVAVSPAGVPSSMAALGDSLTRAYGAGGGGQDDPAESWSTGTASAVDSLYERLLAQNSALSGNEANDAVSGSQVASTTTQAQSAVAQAAAFVTIWSGTNDVCTATTAGMTSVSSFTASLRSTLTELTSNLPGVRVLVLSIPDWYGFWQAYQGNSSAQSAWAAYANRCPDLLSSTATSADRSAVQQRISDLDAAIASVCSQFSACSSDGGAVFRLWPTLTSGDLAFDWFHLSPAGQAAVAAAVWPELPWSGQTTGAPPANSTPPAISGTAQAGRTLTASPGSWTNAPTSYAYQWLDCNASGGSCSAISGATQSTYAVGSGDVGSTLEVQVVASNATGASAPAVSAPTAVVTAPSGGGVFGQTTVGTLTDPGAAGYLDVSGPYAVGATGTLTALHAYVSGGAAASRIRGVVYADSGGAPGGLVAVTPEVSIAASAAAGWIDLPLSAPVSLAAGSYWLGYWYGDGNSRHFYVSSTGAERYAPVAYSSTASPPATFPAAGTSASSYSLDASYTTP